MKKEDLAALTNLSKNKDIVIQSLTKAIMLLLLTRTPTLIDTLKHDTFVNFVVNQEKHIDTTFKNLVDSNSMSKEMRKSVKLVETTGMDKFHA